MRQKISGIIFDTESSDKYRGYAPNDLPYDNKEWFLEELFKTSKGHWFLRTVRSDGGKIVPMSRETAAEWCVQRNRTVP